MQTVAMLLIGDVRMDPRVTKEILTLRSRGFSVTLIQWPRIGPRGTHKYLGIEVIDYPHGLHRRPIANSLRIIPFYFFALRHLKRLSPDFVQCNDLDTLLPGILYQGRTRLIYDAHELFPEFTQGIRKLVWSKLERWMIPACHAYVQPEKNRLAYFSAKLHIDLARIALVENFPSGHYAFSGRSRLRECFKLAPEKIILLYPGVLCRGRGIENMISCMALLDVRFVLVLMGLTFGGYEKKLASLISEAKAEDRVKVHPAIPSIEMLDYINSGDIGLAFYPNTNLNNYWCASNKLYEFILCGKPVITNDYPGLREVVETNQLGACLSETSPQAIASAVRRVWNDKKEPAGTSSYVWERQESTYLKLFG